MWDHPIVIMAMTLKFFMTEKHSACPSVLESKGESTCQSLTMDFRLSWFQWKINLYLANKGFEEDKRAAVLSKTLEYRT